MRLTCSKVHVSWSWKLEESLKLFTADFPRIKYLHKNLQISLMCDLFISELEECQDEIRKLDLKVHEVEQKRRKVEEKHYSSMRYKQMYESEMRFNKSSMPALVCAFTMMILADSVLQGLQGWLVTKLCAKHFVTSKWLNKNSSVQSNPWTLLKY